MRDSLSLTGNRWWGVEFMWGNNHHCHLNYTTTWGRLDFQPTHPPVIVILLC